MAPQTRTHRKKTASPSSRTKRSGKRPLTARTADKHVLYQLSVQDATVEIDFIQGLYKKLRKRKATSFLEHFCGSALLSSEWVRRGPRQTATGVDIDPKVLAWGKKNNVAQLGDAAERVRLLQQDVRDSLPGKHDAVCALNFSYWVFRTRAEMRSYFAHVRKLMAPDGIFVLDAYGGWEGVEPKEERRRVKGGFTYVWDQHVFDPIGHEVENHIHFEFRDGSKMKRAFSYYWRYWTLPELRELLEEAGFGNVTVYWDQSDGDKDEDEDFQPATRAQNQPGWLAYLVATR